MKRLILILLSILLLLSCDNNFKIENNGNNTENNSPSPPYVMTEGSKTIQFEHPPKFTILIALPDKEMEGKSEAEITESIINFTLKAVPIEQNVSRSSIDNNDVHVFPPESIWEGVNYVDTNTNRYAKGDFKSVHESKYTYSLVLMTGEENTEIIGESDKERIAEIAKAFDDHYESWIKDKIGILPDIDDNGKLIILYTPMDKDTGGYFNPSDITGSVVSNNADMIYMAHDLLGDPLYSDGDIISLIAHELQHLLCTYNDYDKANFYNQTSLWMNEGMSMLAQYFTGYSGTYNRSFLPVVFEQSYMSPLFCFENDYVDYGHSMLFFHYLRSRFSEDIIRRIYTLEHKDYKAIEEVTRVDFTTLYTEFCTSLLLSGRGITNDERYEIEAFNYKEGTDEYKKMGFNLKDEIDNSPYIRSLALDFESRMVPYSFNILRYDEEIKELNIEASGGRFITISIF